VEKFKQVVNKLCMLGSIGILIMLCLVYVTSCKTPEKIRINEHTTYTEGTVCVIGMPFNREVNNISRDMAECMNQHALAINRMLVKNYGAKK